MGSYMFTYIISFRLMLNDIDRLIRSCVKNTMIMIINRFSWSNRLHCALSSVRDFGLIFTANK